MKINAPLLFAALALFIIDASAAQARLESDVVVLPTYVVSAPRYLPFEKQMKANLNEVCQQARTPLAMTRELPSLQAQANPPKPAPVTPDAKAKRIARL
jgi:hypothetical protein